AADDDPAVSVLDYFRRDALWRRTEPIGLGWSEGCRYQAAFALHSLAVSIDGGDAILGASSVDGVASGQQEGVSFQRAVGELAGHPHAPAVIAALLEVSARGEARIHGGSC